MRESSMTAPDACMARENTEKIMMKLFFIRCLYASTIPTIFANPIALLWWAHSNPARISRTKTGCNGMSSCRLCDLFQFDLQDLAISDEAFKPVPVKIMDRRMSWGYLLASCFELRSSTDLSTLTIQRAPRAHQLHAPLRPRSTGVSSLQAP